MSIERARKALRGEATDRIPLFDVPCHPGYVKYLTGLDPAADCRGAIVAAMRKLDVDMGMGWVPPSMGGDVGGWRHAESTSKDIFGYDPFQRADIGGMSPDDAYAQTMKEYTDDVAMYGDFCLPIGRTFTTLIHYAAEDLDWEEFMAACACEPEQVDGLLDRCLACSQKNLAAWLRTPIEVMLTHDDIAMSTGMIHSPAWMRRHVFNRYEVLFRQIKASGRVHLFMTDGNFSAVAADVAALGVDGFFLDAPCVDLEWLVGVAGKDKVYFTGPSPAMFATGSPAEIRAEVKRLADIARDDLPRFFFQGLASFMVPGVSTANVAAYYDACLEYGQR